MTVLNGYGIELPPRTRRIPCAFKPPACMIGTTSAYAENTTVARSIGKMNWNYLRVRGEYSSILRLHHGGVELPPRTRRIHGRPGFSDRRQGTTSAYAENTGRRHSNRRDQWNYLRVRGEYTSSAPQLTARLELPPRTRRIQYLTKRLVAAHGTTSAYAENTRGVGNGGHNLGNYLRVRGEYRMFWAGSVTVWELPPRTRRILWL